VKVVGAGWDGMRAVATALPVAREPALNRARPVPRSPCLAGDRAVVRAPALAAGPLRVVSAALTTAGPPRPVSSGAMAQVTRRPVSVWIGAGLLLAAVLQAISLLAWRDVPIALAPAWSEEPLPQEPDPATAAPPVPDARALAAAINAELQRVGVDVQVSLAIDRTAIVSGRVDSVAERDSLLEWLRTVPGVADVDDRLVFPPEPAARPESRAIVTPPAVPAPVARPEVRPPPVVVAPPRPAPATPPVEVARVAPAPPAAAPEPVAPPSAETIARNLQRELARLALPDVSAEVDPATLQITLRGRTHDAARKAQALAAARAATPGGRVRDLVFLVEE